MSGSDQGDQDKGFLARWSQRKQEAKRPGSEAPVADAATPPGPVGEGDAEPEFDLSSLPKLEDVTETTDITAFLRKGVPEHLRNAALRKSWALDPAIRNYVNPALDYAYDWNTPGGVPGSSELGASIDVARLVSQIMGTGETVAEPTVPAAETRTEVADAPAPSGEQKTELPDQPLRLSDQPVSAEQDPPKGEAEAGVDAGQEGNSRGSDSVAPHQVVRRHGSAKPTT